MLIEDQKMAHKVEQRQNVDLIKRLQNHVKNSGISIPEISNVSLDSSSTPPLPSGPVKRTQKEDALQKSGSKSPIIPKNSFATPENKSGTSGVGGDTGKISSEDNQILENDVLVMGLKLGLLQQENFDLEQTIQNLKYEVKKLRGESAKKSKVIAKQLRGIKK